jgi:hypothetical protein
MEYEAFNSQKDKLNSKEFSNMFTKALPNP